MKLKIFNRFSLDMAADLSGLTKHEVTRLREGGAVSPTRTKEGYGYSFSDLLMLRLAKQLRLNNVSLKNICNAHEYLSEIDPGRNLWNYMLYVRLDSKEILYFGDSEDEIEVMVNASKFGQLVIKRMIAIIPIGRQLEAVRQNVISLDSDLEKSMKAKKVVALSAMLKRYGLD